MSKGYKMKTGEFTSELLSSIEHSIIAHSKHPKSPGDSIRFWDNKTPYSIHPIWCAMTLLTETNLPEAIRYNGYQALLWHDILEDTRLPLPEYASDEVKTLVHEMTFQSFEEEREKIEESPDIIKLLKLYDKVSNLMDATWMSTEKWDQMVDYTRTLLDFVIKTYGELNITKIANVVCMQK